MDSARMTYLFRQYQQNIAGILYVANDAVLPFSWFGHFSAAVLGLDRQLAQDNVFGQHFRHFPLHLWIHTQIGNLKYDERAMICSHITGS
jgi:hypothetical protein